MKAELVPENGDPPIPIVKDVTVVGRREFCDVQINHHSLSKRHCVLVKTDGLLIIRDLATTNGTKVKGQRVRWAALLPDDRITLGGYKLRVYLGPDDVPGPSEKAKARGGQTARQVAPAPAVPVRSPTSPPTPPSGFPEPSSASVPAAPRGSDDLEILDDDSDDSGWRRLLTPKPPGRADKDSDGDIVIELD
jgi:predicted component of type VI protein secretion system